MSKTYDAALQNRLDRYCGKDGAGSQAKAASAIGLSESTLSQYRRGIYEGNVTEVESKLREHFNIVDMGEMQPARSSPLRVDGQYVPTSISEHIRKTIRYCQLERGMVISHGDAGIGKTRAAAKFAHENPATTIYLSMTPATGIHSRFLRVLARELRISDSLDKLDMIDEIKAKLLGTSKVLIIDEAQHLKYLTLEEIRNWTTPDPITDRPGTGIVLIGNSQIHTRMVGKQEAQFAQQFSRSRPHRYSTLQIKREDIELMFPVLKERGMKREIDFLHKVSQSKWSLRSAVFIWNDAVNGEDLSYNNLKGIAQRMGIGVTGAV